MKLLLLGFSVLVLASCANSRGSLESTLSLDTLTPGKSHTAVIGTIKHIEEQGSALIIHLAVEKMKQGGATAPAWANGETVKINATPLFLSNYEHSKGKTLVSDIAIESRVMTVLSKGQSKDMFELVQLKTD